MLKRVATTALALGLIAGAAPAQERKDEWLYSTEGNRMHRYRIDSIGNGLVEEIVVASSGDDPVDGRDVNGQICFFPDGSGRFLAGEDTGQSGGGGDPIPQGWGIFDADGNQIGKLTATYFASQPEPFGCAFAPDGTLFTSSVGDPGFGANNGQLIMWFPPYEGFPGEDDGIPYPSQEISENFCKLATNLGTAGAVYVSEAGTVMVGETSGLAVDKFLPPFPTGPDADGGCGATDALGSPLADPVQRELAIAAKASELIGTYSGIAEARNGNLYVASVFTGKISEFTRPDDPLELGTFVRHVLESPSAALPHDFGSPQGLAVDQDGTLYYADLNLVGSLPNVGPGPNGKVWRITFDEFGDPNPPEIVKENLSFPDGLGILSPDATEWRTFGKTHERKGYAAGETVVTPDNVAELAERWRAPAGMIISASAVVAEVGIPGEGRIRVVYYQSWDGFIYAARMSDGRELWRFATEIHPVSFPNTATPTIAKLDLPETVEGRETLFVGTGQYEYAIDAVTGEELWRFGVGTGCRDENGDPPGGCGFDAERNEIESTAVVHDGKVFFGMDVNDVATGKGGFYAVNTRDGSMAWFFDLETGMTCRPEAGQEIRRYDPYHSEEELGLPAGFNSQPGCDFPRSRNGCGNVWSSPALDAERGLLFVASSNCDTDDDPDTGEPEEMPPYDEAIFALDLDGNPVWVWRPREVDNDDLAFGAIPNLFTIDVEGVNRDVVGIGNKDGTYYVLDREGTNVRNGSSWDDDPASHLPADLPYWSRNVVPGGAFGGIVGTPAADEDLRRILFATAPDQPLDPQRPTVHALDMDTGDVAWNNCMDLVNDCDTDSDANFGGTTAVPGLMLIGSVVAPILRAHLTVGDDGTEVYASPPLNTAPFGSAIASGAAVVDGLVMSAVGIGTRTGNPGAISDVVSFIPSDVVALCVPGTSGCAACNDGVDNDGDGDADFAGSGELAPDPGCVSASDPSEVPADLDYDGRVTVTDLDLLFAGFGLGAGDAGFQDAADLDRDMQVTWLDYQLWLETFRAFNAPPPEPAQGACGLLGIEILLVPGVATLLARGRRRARS